MIISNWYLLFINIARKKKPHFKLILVSTCVVAVTLNNHVEVRLRVASDSLLNSEQQIKTIRNNAALNIQLLNFYFIFAMYLNFPVRFIVILFWMFYFFSKLPLHLCINSPIQIKLLLICALNIVADHWSTESLQSFWRSSGPPQHRQFIWVWRHTLPCVDT